MENRKKVMVPTPYGVISVIQGTISNVECVLLARHGRSHNVQPSKVNYRANIRGLKMLECTHVIATTATGSLKAEIKPGDIVILNDFIDRTTSRTITFYDGEEGSPVGVCHLPVAPVFCEKLREVVVNTAKEAGIDVHPTGTVVCIEGPRYSTRAESHVYRSWNGDLVGMTQVPEVILAKEAGLLYASIAMATDYDAWREHESSVSVTEVMATFKKNVEKVTRLVLELVPIIAQCDWSSEIADLKAIVEASIMLPNQYNK